MAVRKKARSLLLNKVSLSIPAHRNLIDCSKGFVFVVRGKKAIMIISIIVDTASLMGRRMYKLGMRDVSHLYL